MLHVDNAETEIDNGILWIVLKDFMATFSILLALS